MLGDTTDITNDTSFLNTGALTLGNGGDVLTFAGGVDALAGNAISVGGTVNTTDTAMDFGDVSLNAASTFDTNNAALGTMVIGAVTTVGNQLTLDSGSTADATMDIGAIDDATGGVIIRDAGGLATIASVGGAAGTLQVVDSQAGVTFAGVVNVGIVDLDATTGTIEFSDNLTATTLTTTGDGFNVRMLGDTTTITDVVDFANTGFVTFGDGGDTLTFTNGLTRSGNGLVNIGGTVQSTNSDIHFGTGAAELTSTSEVDSSGGNITFGGIVDGAGEDLTLDAGAAGNIVFTGAVGGGGRLGVITIENANDVTSGAAATITAESLVQTTGQGITTLGAAVNTDDAGVNIVTGTISVDAGITATNAGDVNLDATAGTLTMTENADVAASGAVNFTAAGGIFTAGHVITSASTDYNSAVNLTGDVTSTSIGAITFDSTISGGETLALSGNTVTLLGSVGDSGAGLIALTSLDVTGDATLAAITLETVGAMDFNNTVTLNGDVTANSAGAITFDDTISGAQALVLNGNTVTLLGSIGDTGAALTALASLNVTGNATLATNGDIAIETNGAVDFNNTVQLDNSVFVTSNDNTITFADSVNGGGADLLLDAGAAGTISATSMLVNNLEIINSNGATFTGTVGTVGNLTITDTEDGAVVSFQDAVNVDDLVTTANGYLVSMTGTGNTFNLNVDFLNTGAVTLGDAAGDSFLFTGGMAFTGGAASNVAADIITVGTAVDFGVGGVQLDDNTTIRTAGGDVTFGGALDGEGAVNNRTLDITAGAGNVTFNGLVGGADPDVTGLGDTTIVSANNVTTAADFAAMSLTVNATGTTLLGGDTSAFNDLTVNAATITANGDVQSDQGNIAMTATGVLTHADNTTVFAQAGTVDLTGNTINLGADVATGGGNDISVNGATTLTSDVTVSSGALGGDVTFASTVDGGQDLVVTSGTGTVNFNGDVGTTIALNSLNVTGATTIAGVDVTADNNVDLNSNVSLTTGAVAVTSNAGDITFGGTIDGAVDLTIAATLGDTQIDGAVGAGAALATLTATNGGDFTADGTMTTVGDMTVDADGDLEFGGNLTAGGDISLETGSVGTIAFEAAVTDVTADGDIVLSNAVVSATTVPTIATITSESTTGITFDAGGDFTMTAGEKLTTFGDLTITTGANGTASLGDLVTIGDIRVTADTINFISRNAGDVLNADGTTTEDQGIDVVASGQFFFSVAPGLTGGLRPVHFASNTVEADALGTLDAWIVRWTDSSITLNSIVNGTTILDLAADGIDSLNNFEVAELAGAIRPMSTMTPIVMPGHDTFEDDGNGDDDEETIQEASIR